MPSTTLQEKIDHFLELLHRKSQERLTIMVIPHSQEKIFSLHLNWLMVLFLVGTLLFAVVLAGYGYYLHESKYREVMRLKGIYGVNFQFAYKLQSETEKLRNRNEQLQDNLVEIAEIVGVPDEELSLLPSFSSSLDSSENLLRSEVIARTDMAPGSDYLPSVYFLKQNNALFLDRSPLMGTVQRFLDQGFGAYYYMPLGRPFRGFRHLRDSSGFGMRIDPISKASLEFHTGMDTSGPPGTPIYATAPGTVHRITLWDPGYGNSVLIKHKDNFFTLYAHLSRINVFRGQVVKQGQLVGKMGRTGRVTGNHLHYEVWVGTSRIDPLPYVCSVDFKTSSCKRYNRTLEE